MNLQQIIEQEASDRYPDNWPRNTRTAFISGANFALELDRWIKIEDGLPEPGTNVLAYDSHRNAVAVCYILNGVWVVNKDFIDGFDCTTYKGAIITHYQPITLPQK